MHINIRIKEKKGLNEYQNYTIISGDSKGRIVCLVLNTLEPWYF